MAQNFLSSVGNLVLDIFESLIIALAFFVITYLFAFQPHEVVGSSMNGLANFHDGQYILTDKLTYRFREPHRGEVVVFKYPLKKNTDYIKRIIALPGEEIMLKNNRIYIYNEEHPEGFALDETPYIGSDVQTEPRAFLKEGEKVKIPSESFVAMGDNRPDSSDSRTWGFVPKSDIIGRSYFRYWPTNEVGLLKTPTYNENSED